MSTLLSGRALKVLGRFPRHLEADAPGKLLGVVVQALVCDQDVLAANLQAIRQAHRLHEAQELHDLLLLAGLHGLRRSEMAVLFARHAELQKRLAALRANVETGGDSAARVQLANDLLALWSLSGNNLLQRFADDNPPTTHASISRLLPQATAACGFPVLLDGVRQRIATTARIHAGGNGTVRALLTGAANALDLDLGKIIPSPDRYWHAAPVWDRLRLRLPPSDNFVPGDEIEPQTEYLGLEENPLVPAERGPHPRQHAELFEYIRKGFDDALLEIRVRGVGNRTISPMFVNRDAGHGVGAFVHVPDGKDLIFNQQGRVLLDGADITSRAWAWQGACFAENSGGNGNPVQNNRDFVFADAALSQAQHAANRRTSRFAVITPTGSLTPEARLPHAGDSLPVPAIGVGKTRFAFFVQHGCFSSTRHLVPISDAEIPPTSLPQDSDPFGSTPVALLNRIQLVTPRYAVGFVGAALFAQVAGDKKHDAAAQVSLHWFERQAYHVRVLIPNRFRALGHADGGGIREQVKHAIQRFRPAGVEVQVDFAEDQWVLGKAALPSKDATGTDAISQVQSSTLLWPSPATHEELQ